MQWQALFGDSTVRGFKPITAWNSERLFELHGSNCITWDTITSGNFVGFDAWVDGKKNAKIDISTTQCPLSEKLEAIGIELTIVEASGLGKALSVQRLPEELLRRQMTIRRKVAIRDQRDTPICISVRTEDGYHAWSSPLNIFKQ